MATTIKPKKIEEKPLTPQFINPTTPDKKGYGVKLPSGETIDKLDADTAFRLQTGYKKPKLSEDEQIKADFERNQKAEAYAQSQQPATTPLLNPNQEAELAGSLTSTIDVMGEKTTKDINKMNTAAAASQEDLMGVIPLNKFSGSLVKALNKVGNSGAGNVLLSMAPTVLKDYLNDYSNDDSFEKIKTRTGDAKSGIDYAIQLSRDPARAVESAELFETSIKSIRIAESQLKLISTRGYDKDVNKQLEEITFYLEKIAPNQLRTMQLNMAMGGVQ